MRSEGFAVGQAVRYRPPLALPFLCPKAVRMLFFAVTVNSLLSVSFSPVLAAMSPLACAMSGVQILGIVAAGMARLAEGTRHERACHWLLLLSLAIVGGLCGFALQFGAAAGAICSVTLMVMTMISVVDLRSAG